MSTIVDYDVAIEVACHEAVVRQAYLDSENNWTWSVGLTSATGHMVERYIGKPQSLEHCLRVYVWALDNYANAVRRAFEGVPLTDAQFTAALSFHWNTGAIESATWVKQFKAGKIAAARKSFMNWSTPKSIIGRREKERDLFFDGKWSNDGTMTEWTNVNPSGHINWSSGKKINVEKELKAALAGEIPASDKIIVEHEKPTVPQQIDDQVKQKSSWWQKLTGGLFGSGGVGAAAFGLDWRIVALFLGAGLFVSLIFLFARNTSLSAIKDARKAFE